MKRKAARDTGSTPPEEAGRFAWLRISGPGRFSWLQISGPSTLIVLLGFVVAYYFVEPAPPEELVMATGDPDGVYFRFGEQYKEAFAESGITLVTIPTAGTIENLELLRTGAVSVAFVQGGTAPDGAEAYLEALGSVYLEPWWVIYRGDKELAVLSDLRGLRIATGVAGSGTRAVTLRFLSDSGVNDGNTPFEAIGGRDAADALISGRVDVACFVVSPSLDLIRELLGTPGLRLMSLRRHLAFKSHYTFLTSVKLGEGVVDLRNNIPAKEAILLAPAASVVVGTKERLHPALESLLLQVMDSVHAERGLFAEEEDVVPKGLVDLPLSKRAERYYATGAPMLQRYLPFWTATLVDRLKIMLLPLFTLFLPLMRLGPPIYVWRTRLKVYRWYGILRKIDQRYQKGESPEMRDQDIARLRTLDTELATVNIPLAYMTEFYDLRLHISYVLRCLEESTEKEGKAGRALL